MKYIIVICLTLLWASIAFADFFPRGLYVYMWQADAIPTSSMLTNTNIDGFSVRVKWKSVEATHDVYDWSYLDARVAEATTNNKQIVLSIKPPSSSSEIPTWYTGATFVCHDRTIIISWDPQYRKEFAEVLRLMVNRYKDNDSVAGFWVTGAHNSGGFDWAYCNNNADDRAGLITAGYTRQKIQDSLMLFYENMLMGGTTKPIMLYYAGTVDETTGLFPDMTSTNDYILNPMLDKYGQSVTARSVSSRNFSNRSHSTRTMSPRAWLAIARSTFSSITDAPKGVNTTGDPLQVWNSNAIGTQFQPLIHPVPSGEPFTYNLNFGPNNTFGQRDGAESTPVSLDFITQTIDIALHYKLKFFEIREEDANEPTFQTVLACASVGFKTIGAHCGH